MMYDITQKVLMPAKGKQILPPSDELGLLLVRFELKIKAARR